MPQTLHAFLDVGTPIPGPAGPPGAPGEPTNILAPVPTEGDLPSEGERGDAVLTEDSGDLWSWNTPENTGTMPRPGKQANEYDWINVGHVVGPEGPAGFSSSAFDYLFSPTVAAPPGGGQIRLNNADQTLATNLWINSVTSPGNDAGILLRAIASGDTLIVQDKDDGTRWQEYLVNADAIDHGTWVEVPVEWKTGGSDLQPQRVFLIVRAAGIPGPKGDKGDKGDTGATGATGPQGAPGQSAGRIFYYIFSDTSDIAGYRTLSEMPGPGTEVSVPVTCTGTADTLVGRFVTEPGVPGEVPWPPGTVFRRIFASTSAGSARLHVEVYKRAENGTETLVRSEFSPAFSNTTATLQDWTVILPYPGVAMSVTDRLVSKVYAARVSGPGTMTVTCYFEGVYGSHIQTTISAGAQGPPGPPGPQTPWAQNIDAAGYTLSGLKQLTVAAANVAGTDNITGISLNRGYDAVGDSMDLVWGPGPNRLGRISGTIYGGGEAAFIFHAMTGGADGYSNEVFRVQGNKRVIANAEIDIKGWGDGEGGDLRLCDVDGTPNWAVDVDSGNVLRIHRLGTLVLRISPSFSIQMLLGGSLKTLSVDGSGFVKAT